MNLSRKTADDIFARADAEGITSSDIARHLEVTPGAVTQWRNGTRTPGLDVLARLADAVDSELVVRLRRKR